MSTDTWTPARKKRLIRDKKGRFKLWTGGKTKHEITKKRMNYRAHGIRVHIGKEFARQKGRPARIGDTVRTKNINGSYNKAAEWYVNTRYGWRNLNTKTTPGAARIRKTLDHAKPSRSRR